MNFTQQIFEDVKEFYKGQIITLPTKFTPLTKERQAQRDLFLLEEYREFTTALDKYYFAQNTKDGLLALCEIYDALCDILYIGAGTILEKGYDYALHEDCFVLDEPKSEFMQDKYEFLVTAQLHSFLRLLQSIYGWLYNGFTITQRKSEINCQCLIECWAEVHRSNLSKRLPDGSYLYNGFDKIIKPTKENNSFAHEYSKANLLPIIEKYFKV